MGEYVGVDVSKKWLDVVVESKGEPWRVSNDAIGIATVVERLSAMATERIVVEATGGWEREVVAGLYLAGLPVAMVNPGRVRFFARSLGQRAKTDQIDAALLATFGRLTQPLLTRLPSAQEEALQELVTRRRQVVDMLTMEKNRRHTVRPAGQARLDKHIQWLEQEAGQLQAEIEALLRQLPEMNAKYELLLTAPGVGLVTSATLLADLPELGQLSRQEVAALAGLAPYNNDSGARRGQRSIAGGRAAVRKAMYMATVSALKCNPVIRDYKQHLCAQGKPTKVAIVACMRKFLTMLNAMIRDQRPWLDFAPTPCP